MASRPTAKRIVLLHEDEARRLQFEQALAAERCQVVGCYDLHANLPRVLAELQPDLVLIGVDLPTADLLESLHRLRGERSMPMVLFAARSTAAITRRALEAGISDFIVDGLHAARMGPLFEVAMTRFELEQKLRDALDDARVRLADHRDIGKAKGLIMKRRELDEDQAYQLLRKMAMDRQQRLGDFSRLLLVASAAL